MSKPIAFIIGAGKRVGASTERLFLSNGYRVAKAARSLDAEPSSNKDLLAIKVDLASPHTVANAFDTIRKQWGEPNVVIYNAAAAHFPKGDIFNDISVEDFTIDANVNIISMYAAAREAVNGFKNISDSGLAKVFIATGNALNVMMVGNGNLVTLGAGKAAAAHVIHSASLVYKDSGYRFYYADERTSEGDSVGNNVNGDGHADFLASLVDGKAASPVPWHATFVSGVGYKKFPIPQ